MLGRLPPSRLMRQCSCKSSVNMLPTNPLVVNKSLVVADELWLNVVGGEMGSVR